MQDFKKEQLIKEVTKVFNVLLNTEKKNKLKIEQNAAKLKISVDKLIFRMLEIADELTFK